MKLSDIKKLRSGDEVFWNDPNGGEYSRIYTIQTIEIRKSVNTVIIKDIDGSEIECFASELA